MNDDEVLDAMKQTLTGVRMDHAVEAIEQRGRVRRRNRTLFGIAAGGGLAAAAALALALPMATQQAATSPASAATATASAQAMAPTAFTLDTLTGNEVKLVLHKEITDPKALQSALKQAGIPAVVKLGVHCVSKGKELSQANQVYRTDVAPPNYQFAFIITPAAMPANSELFFTIFHPGADANGVKVDVALVTKGAPMNCVPEKDI